MKIPSTLNKKPHLFLRNRVYASLQTMQPPCYPELMKTRVDAPKLPSQISYSMISPSQEIWSIIIPITFDFSPSIVNDLNKWT
jgi:hypothetical protein